MRWLPALIPAVMVTLAGWTIYRDRMEKARLSDEQKAEDAEMERKLKEFEAAYLSTTGQRQMEIAVEWGAYLTKFEAFKEVPPIVANGLRRYEEVVRRKK